MSDVVHPRPVPPTHPSVAPVLEVADLAVEFATRTGSVRVVEEVAFSVGPGEIVGLVGESGSGKTVTMMSVLRLVPPPGRIAEGRITLDGVDVRSLTREEMRALRGSTVALIPPDATAALNPVVKVGDQVMEGVRSHRPSVSEDDARKLALEMFRRVGLPRPEQRLRRYPHELSGGMQQRVLIASALQMEPRLILADEPTTALDVTIQAQILRLLLAVRDEFGTAILFVTHDLAAVAEICDRVLVMYSGRLVESAPVDDLFGRPLHPYTRALMASIPPLSAEPPDRHQAVAGAPPEPGSWPPGCRFAPRCGLRSELGEPEICTTLQPPLVEFRPNHRAACHFAGSAAGVAAAEAMAATVGEAEVTVVDAPGVADASMVADTPVIEGRP
jgi:oligopeptide/dipeptide ABC transporter ATP-binding protein